jgi:hypothetical protein
VDHAIVAIVADDDRALMERLAALEAEVKADADAQRARKDAAVARVREQRVPQAPDEEPVRRRAPQAARPRRTEPERDDADEGLGGAIELASKANRVKRELQRPRKKGEKSWVVSGVASLALGPAGWLYAGSWREAVPATAAWVMLTALASSFLPVFLMLPVLMVVLPLSAIGGVVYALQYNRSGTRQRLFDSEKKSQKTKRIEGE